MSEIVVNMDGGVGGSWKELTEEEEAASLEITVEERDLAKQKDRRLNQLRQLRKVYLTITLKTQPQI